MDCQDWKPVILHKKESTAPVAPHPPSAYGATGKPIQERKYKEDEFGMPITKGLHKGFGKKMQQARQQKGWSQKELAQKIGEKVQVVQEYEQEKVLNVNNGIIKKIERHLGSLK